MLGTVTPRAGVPAATMPTPTDERDDTGHAEPGAPAWRRPAPRDPSRTVAVRRRRRSAPAPAGRAVGGPGTATTRPASRPTFDPNSSVWGAISKVLATATRKPKTTRPTRPAGTVFGSVIMKKRKIITSGDVTITRQKSAPQTGSKAQSGRHAVARRGQDPDAQRRGRPRTSPPGASRCRRLVISSPPVRMTAYAAIIQTFSGAHQKSSGSTRVVPSTMNATTSPMFDGLKTWVPRKRMTYFVSSDRAGDDRVDLPARRMSMVVERRADDAQDERDAAAGQHRAGRPDEGLRLPEGQRDLEDRAGQDRREDLRHARPGTAVRPGRERGS